MREEKFKDKFKDDEKTKVESKLDELTKWFEANPDSDAESYGNK